MKRSDRELQLKIRKGVMYAMIPIFILMATAVFQACRKDTPMQHTRTAPKVTPFGQPDDRLVISGRITDKDGNPIEGVEMVVESQGDYDNDNDMDLDDYAQLYACLSGPDVPATPECLKGDSNWDGHIDMKDVRYFQMLFTGPDNPIVVFGPPGGG